jgi:SurA-like protein
VSPRFRPLLLASLVALLLLSGCGTTFQSAAAVVNGTRISEATLRLRLTALLANPQVSQQLAGPTAVEQRKSFARRLLAFLIREQLVHDFAARRSLTVSRSEIDILLKQVIQQSGGQTGFDRELTRRHLTVADVRTNIQQSLLEGKVRDTVALSRFGSTATDQQKTQAFNQWLTAQFRSADIEVNPRFGRFDPAKGTVCAIDSTAATTACP